MKRKLLLGFLLPTVAIAYGNAPGTYPKEELSDQLPTVPQSPYGNSGGYQFYYEKDPPKSKSSGKGRLPPFQPLFDDFPTKTPKGNDGEFAIYTSAEESTKAPTKPPRSTNDDSSRATIKNPANGESPKVTFEDPPIGEPSDGGAEDGAQETYTNGETPFTLTSTTNLPFALTTTTNSPSTLTFTRTSTTRPSTSEPHGAPLIRSTDKRVAELLTRAIQEMITTNPPIAPKANHQVYTTEPTVVKTNEKSTKTPIKHTMHQSTINPPTHPTLVTQDEIEGNERVQKEAKKNYNDWDNKKPKYLNNGEPNDERLSVIEDVVESTESIDGSQFFNSEEFKKKSREPLVDDKFLPSHTKDLILERSGLDMKELLSKSTKKCCTCCDENKPISRNAETKVESATQIDEAPGDGIFTGDGRDSIGEGYTQYGRVANTPSTNSDQLLSPYPAPNVVKKPAFVPEFQQVGYAQLPQYPPQYPPPQYQSPACNCQPVSQPCCQPPRPCCLPQIPCCPQPQCCPQPRICCQPIQPICLPLPEISCCTISLSIPTIQFPICGRACPSCPCRRRLHRAKRVKRFVSSGPCTKCSVLGEPWRPMRTKRHACSAAPNPLLQQPSSGCTQCNPTHKRVKRMGCLPCLGRKKRETGDHHERVKRMGCLPCLGRRKKRSLADCQTCSNLGGLLKRFKRSFLGCSPCGRKKRQAPTCSCARDFLSEIRGKREIKREEKKETCDKSCCDYTRCPSRKKTSIFN